MHKKKGVLKFVSVLMTFVIFLTGGISTAVEAKSIESFTDVDGHWGKPAITWCVDRNYMVGVGNNRFDPNGTVTRAQVTQVLYNMAGSPNASGYKNTYRDVAEKSWYRNAITWAHEFGILYDLDGKEIRPNQPAERQEIAYMFWKFAEKIDTSNERAKFEINEEDVKKFPDWFFIGKKFWEGEIWAVHYGLMQGDGCNLLPRKPITRAELAQVIKNFFTLKTVPYPDANPSPSPSPTIDPTLPPPTIGPPSPPPTTDPTLPPPTIDPTNPPPTINPTNPPPTINPTNPPPTIDPTNPPAEETPPPEGEGGGPGGDLPPTGEEEIPPPEGEGGEPGGDLPPT